MDASSPLIFACDAWSFAKLLRCRLSSTSRPSTSFVDATPPLDIKRTVSPLTLSTTIVGAFDLDRSPSTLPRHGRAPPLCSIVKAVRCREWT